MMPAKEATLRSAIASEAGIIQAIDNGFFLTFESCPAGEFSLGAKAQAVTMLQIWELEREGVVVGFYLYSAFCCINRGGVLTTYLKHKRGKAEKASVVLRTPHLVVYDVAGCGSMAVSPTVNTKVADILKEQ